MIEAPSNPSWVAVIAGLAGIALTKGLDWFVAWRQRHQTGDSAVTLAEMGDSTQIRQELWRRVGELDTRNDELRQQLFEQMTEQARCRASEEQLGRDVAELRAQVEQLRLQLDATRGDSTP